MEVIMVAIMDMTKTNKINKKTVAMNGYLKREGSKS
jgi:hypothetical protein